MFGLYASVSGISVSTCLTQGFSPGGDLAMRMARRRRLDGYLRRRKLIFGGVEDLHTAGVVVYCGLRSIIGADGHIVLADFERTKEFSCHTAR